MKKLRTNPANAGRQVIKLGFWGTGSKNLYGNISFAEITAKMGVPAENLYVQKDGLRATREFFSLIDLNRNRKLSGDEVKLLDVEVCGYSWGAIAAIGFCQRLSTTGTIVVGGSPRSPITFELGAPVRIKKLLVVDPVPIFNSPGVVPSTVDHFINFYQCNGGDGVLRSAHNHEMIVDKSSTVLSRLLKGMRVETKAVKSDQFNIGVNGMTASDRLCFAFGSETNHDTIPWFVDSLLAKQGSPFATLLT